MNDFPRSSMHPNKIDNPTTPCSVKNGVWRIKNVRLTALVELEQGIETVFHERVRNELIAKEPNRIDGIL